MRSYFFDRKGEGKSYTDLALERHRAFPNAGGVEYTSAECGCGIWETVRIYSREGEENLQRPMGRYHTLTTGRLDLLTEDEIDECTEEIARKLCSTVDLLDCLPERIFVVGLGNAALTPDSFGPRAAKKVKPTLHIKNFDEEMFYALECSEIVVLAPGVSAETGVDAIEIVRGVSKRICPDLIIAIDAIATREEERLGSTIQISDTGLHPGRGVGNSGHALTEETIGIPIISVGIPTVIDSRAFKEGDGADNISNSMLVAPREIDDIIDVGARVIGGAINQAFGIDTY
jgi:spore protease